MCDSHTSKNMEVSACTHVWSVKFFFPHLSDSTEGQPWGLEHLLILVSEKVNESTQELWHIVTVVGAGVGTEGQKQGHCCLGHTKVVSPAHIQSWVKVWSRNYLSIVSDVSFPTWTSHEKMAKAEEPPLLPIHTLSSCLFNPSPSISNSFMHVLFCPFLPSYN